MNVTFFERLQSRLVSRLCSASRRQSWICESCRARLGRPRWSSRTLWTSTGDNEAQTGTLSRDELVKKRRDAFSKDRFPSSNPIDDTTGGNGAGAVELDKKSHAEASDDAFIEKVLTDEDDSAISNLIKPENWPMVQWNAMAPFREFLIEQAQPQTRLDRRKNESDTYGILLALRTRDPERIVSALLFAEDDPEHLRSIPATTWTEILHGLDPRKFALDQHKVHRSFNEGQLIRAGFNYRILAGRYLKILSRILGVRRAYGTSPDIADYQVLLTYAATIGAVRAARGLWADMKSDDVPPDRICYNRYMEAIVWDEESRLKLASKAIDSFPRTHVKATNIALFKRGSSREIGELIGQMKADGVQPDVATYCLLMYVLARDADFKSVSNIVSGVWNINVQALEAGREDPSLMEKHAPGSVLHPTPRLLVTIAEVYGLANRMPAGFRVVDYISRHYELPLNKHIWYQLLRWTWLQARVKPHQRTVPEENPQQLSQETVQMLLETMVSEPYHIKPDLDMYHIAFNNFRNSPFAFVERFDPSLGIEILESVRLEYIKKLQESREGEQPQIAPHLQGLPTWTPSTRSGSLSLCFADEKRLRKEKALYRMKLEEWTKQILTLPRRKHFGIDVTTDQYNACLTEWRVRGLPCFLALMATFAPSNLYYHTDTGVVHLTFRDWAKAKVHEAQGKAAKLAISPRVRERNKQRLRLEGELRAERWSSLLKSFRSSSEDSGLYEPPEHEDYTSPSKGDTTLGDHQQVL